MIPPAHLVGRDRVGTRAQLNLAPCMLKLLKNRVVRLGVAAPSSLLLIILRWVVKSKLAGSRPTVVISDDLNLFGAVVAVALL